jgi:hypothetical protein
MTQTGKALWGRGRGRPRLLGARPWWQWAVLALLAVAIGAASALWRARSHDKFGQAAGPWRVSLLAGSAQADALTRARVALGGLLALHRSETMYFLAGQDSQGRPLRRHCAYRVSGVAPQALWWSLTAYADDHFLFPDDQRRYSINSATAVLNDQGRFQVRVGQHPPAGTELPWLPTPGQGGLLLALRVYKPSAALQADPSRLDPPRIEEEAPCA